MSKLKIAIQKNGRLGEDSLKLLKECGIQIPIGDKKLKAEATNFPVEILFLRDDDIPQCVEQGVADLGIVGGNEVWEQEKKIQVIQQLGFAGCKLSLAIPKDEDYYDLNYFEGKKIATSYPTILKSYFTNQKIDVSIEEISGSVEIATGIGLADAIFDIVGTGSTLLMNGLKEVEVVSWSEAVLVSNQFLNKEKQQIVKELVFRINAVKNASKSKYILLNAPNSSIDSICNILPGMKSPTILPLADKDWSSLHSVVQEDQFWDVIDQLKDLGAQGILVVPIEKMIL